MSDEIKDAEKYLEARLAECSSRPELHKNTIAVYNSYLKVIRERPGDYIKEAGDMFAVMKAEQLDRNEDFALLYEKFSQVEKVKAYKTISEAVQNSSGYGDIYMKTGDARQATEALLNIEYKKRELLANLCRGITAWRVEIPAERGSIKANIIKHWNSLQELDPQLSWEKIKTQPGYRNSLYYNDGQFALIEKWFREITA